MYLRQFYVKFIGKNVWNKDQHKVLWKILFSAGALIHHSSSQNTKPIEIENDHYGFLMLMKSDTSDELSIKWKIEFLSQYSSIITSDIIENIETIICY